MFHLSSTSPVDGAVFVLAALSQQSHLTLDTANDKDKLIENCLLQIAPLQQHWRQNDSKKASPSVVMLIKVIMDTLGYHSGDTVCQDKVVEYLKEKFEFMTNTMNAQMVLNVCQELFETQMAMKVKTSVQEDRRLMGALRLVVIIFKLIPVLYKNSSKLQKLMMQVQSKFAYLQGHVTQDYLYEQLPQLFHKKSFVDAEVLLKGQMQSMDDTIDQVASTYKTKVGQWLAKVPPQQSVRKFLDWQLAHLVQGVRTCLQISKYLTEYVALHGWCESLISVDNVMIMCLMISRHKVLHRKLNEASSEFLNSLLRHVALNFLVIIEPLKDEDKVKGLVETIRKILWNQPQVSSLHLLRSCVTCLIQLYKFPDDIVGKLRLALSQYQFLVEYYSDLDKSQTSMSNLLLSNTSLVKIFLKECVQKHNQAFKEFMESVSDVIYLPQSQEVDSFENVVEKYWNDFVVEIASTIESDLRYRSLELQQMSSELQFLEYLTLPTFELFGFVVDFKLSVSLKIQQAFYNANAFNLQDSHTYHKARQIGKYLYDLDLNTVKTLLPKGCPNYSASTDIVLLAVNSQLDSVISEYGYDFLRMSFVDSNEVKQTIEYGFIENSFIMHGKGISASVVQGLYELSISKIQLVQDWLSKDHITSMLLKYQQQNILFAEYVELYYQDISKVVELVGFLGNCLALARCIATTCKNDNFKTFVESLTKAKLELFYLAVPFVAVVQSRQLISKPCKKDNVSVACAQVLNLMNAWDKFESLDWSMTGQDTIMESSSKSVSSKTSKLISKFQGKKSASNLLQKARQLQEQQLKKQILRFLNVMSLCRQTSE